MQENIVIPQSKDKEECYQLLLPQVTALTSGEVDLIANLANIAGALHYGMGFHWTGFYLVKNGELVVGPYQGPIANTRIPYGKGICGTALAEERVICVEDVEQFPGHIPLNERGKSQIVIPGFKNGEVAVLLKVNSKVPGQFDRKDECYLSKIMHMIERFI